MKNPFYGTGLDYNEDTTRRSRQERSYTGEVEKKMERLLFWLQRKKRIAKKQCGQCCLFCPYYRDCREDGG